jgi:hypothetical protein
MRCPSRQIPIPAAGSTRAKRTPGAVPAPALFCLLLVLVHQVNAQSGVESAGAGLGGEFFAGMSVKTAVYSVNNGAFGGGLAWGYSFDIGALGLNLDYLVDPDGLTTFAPGIFLRFYLPPAPFHSGPFLQFDFGPTFHTRDPRIPAIALVSAVSAGLSGGWRFLLGEHWYAEPFLRGGYPFIVGGGLAAGYRF